MHNKKLAAVVSLAVLLTVSSLLSGCTNDSNPNEPNQPPAAPDSVRDLQLRTILSKSASSEHKQTPVQTVLHQLEWELSNSEKQSPSEQNVKWETTFLQSSVVVLKVPVTDPWYNVVVLTQQGQEWTMAGLADMHVNKEDALSDQKGLDLPMENFAVSTIPLNAEGHHIWAFAGDQKQVIIGKYPHDTPFSVLEKAESVQVKGMEAWTVTEDTGRSLLYYIDQGHVVWLTGNVSESELVTLANSLPSSTFYAFPFAE